MKFNTPRFLKWSGAKTTASSLLLAVVCLLGVRVLTAKGYFPEYKWGLREFSSLLSVFAAVVGLVAPPLILLCWKIFSRLRPRPGTQPFAEDELRALHTAFEIERGNIQLATVPEHRARAKAAKGAGDLDLGDARLVVPEQSQGQIKDFLKQRRRSKERGEESLTHNVLVVTGEPGAGKSVLLQEIHASLSLGVEEGHHSFVPLFVFARYLTLDSLDKAFHHSDAPMRAFIISYYEKQCQIAPGNERLVALLDLVTHHWFDNDFLLIIDGLDEIAQRSVYENIQRRLVEIIKGDLEPDQPMVHRYIVSCRVDEDIGLFQGARSLFLKGLDEDEAEEFCNKLIADSGLDKRLTAAIQVALRSPQVMPSHVFRRNPYFLSLLWWYIRNEQHQVRERPIDFDVLMRQYIEREAIRPYASAEDDSYLKSEDRRATFRELERVSRACLQYLAFRSASSAKIGALYDETSVDADLVIGFVKELESSSKETNERNPWNTLPQFLDYLAVPSRVENIAPETISRFSESLHENDVRLLNSLANQLRSGEISEQDLLRSAIGTIPYQTRTEDTAWYRGLLENFLVSLRGRDLTFRQTIAVLLFVRSIASAHALRILLVTSHKEGTTIRLKHRRLAEYYAGCYLRNRWADLEGVLQLTPWLGPVLNLACALESEQCRAFDWLVSRVEDEPTQPLYEWRYAVEAAVEASFFAHPGLAYQEAVHDLTRKIVAVLARHTSSTKPTEEHTAAHSKQTSPSETTKGGLPVTQMTLLRAIEQLGRLEDLLSAPLLDPESTQRLQQYEASLPVEWIGEFVPTRMAIRKISDRSTSLLQDLLFLSKLVRQPSAVLFFRTRLPWKGVWPIWSLVAFTTLVGEACRNLAILAILLFGDALFMAILTMIGVADPVVFEAGTAALVLVCSVAVILRGLAWRRSRTETAASSALPWRVTAVLIQAIIGAVRRSEGVLAFLSRGLNTLRQSTTQPSRRPAEVSRSISEIFLSLAAISILAAALIFVGLKRSPQYKKPTLVLSCDAVNDQVKAVRLFAATKALHMKEESAQTELRGMLRELHSLNQAQTCGWDTKESWVRAEDGIVDELAEGNPTLVPWIASGEVAMSIPTMRTRSELLARTSKHQTLLTTLYHLRRSVHDFKDTEDIRRQILEARRQGVGIPVGPEYTLAPFFEDAESKRRGGHSIEASTALLTSLNATIERQRLDLESAERTLVYPVVGFLVLGILVKLLSSIRKDAADSDLLEKVRHTLNVEELCAMLLNASYSERVRLGVLGQLDTVGVNGQKGLSLLEEVAGELLSRSSPTERSLGVKTTRLVRTLSNRLRHRGTVDAPRRGTMALGRE
jgi:hypothetical protein